MNSKDALLTLPVFDYVQEVLEEFAPVISAKDLPQMFGRFMQAGNISG